LTRSWHLGQANRSPIFYHYDNPSESRQTTGSAGKRVKASGGAPGQVQGGIPTHRV
jgi:hypothetical protein